MDVLLLITGIAGVSAVIGKERAAALFVTLAGLAGAGILATIIYGLAKF